MTHDDAKRLVVTFVESLSANQIVEIDADRIGAAVFKSDGRIRLSTDFVDGVYSHRHIKDRWTKKLGHFQPLFLFGGGHEDVYELAYYDALHDEECRLDLLLRDQAWVQAYAESSRARMLLNASIFADRIIDFLNFEVD